MMRSLLGSVAFVVAGVCVTSLADANVSLKNLNFYQGYTDVLFPGGLELKIERVYNSKTGFNGIFGWGWGAAFETYYSVSCDTSLTMHEYGGGAENVFTLPGHPTADEVDMCVEKIVAGAKRPAGEVALFRAKLKRDSTARREEWDKLVASGTVPQMTLATGTYRSTRFGAQTVTTTNDGIQRTSGARRETFDRKGRFTKIEDANQNWIAYGYDDRGLRSMNDNLGHGITIELTPNKKIKGFITTSGKKGSYRYDDHGNLVETKDIDGNVYRHSYNARHNMTAIDYADKTRMEIGYFTFDRQEGVRFVRERDGGVTTYAFSSATDGLAYTVATEVSDKAGKIESTSRYDYSYFEGGADRRLVTTLDGDRTATTYDKECQLPIEIEHGVDKTVFAYDEHCHVTLKDTPAEVTWLTYAPGVNKVARVERGSKSDPKHEKTWSEFTYDDKGNLLTADDSEGRRISLVYDSLGRIATMTDLVKNQTMSFRYNPSSKPVAIAVSGVGVITVTYEADDVTVRKVESPQGREVALTVTSSFQVLLDVIRPAGVSLSL